MWVIITIMLDFIYTPIFTLLEGIQKIAGGLDVGATIAVFAMLTTVSIVSIFRLSTKGFLNSKPFTEFRLIMNNPKLGTKQKQAYIKTFVNKHPVVTRLIINPFSGYVWLILAVWLYISLRKFISVASYSPNTSVLPIDYGKASLSLQEPFLYVPALVISVIALILLFANKFILTPKNDPGTSRNSSTKSLKTIFADLNMAYSFNEQKTNREITNRIRYLVRKIISFLSVFIVATIILFDACGIGVFYIVYIICSLAVRKLIPIDSAAKL